MFVTSFSCTRSHTFVSFQAFNLAGRGNLPEGFACVFVGGWLFNFPSMLSMFYACSLALNTQLVFVHGRTVKENHQVLFLAVPAALASLISTSASLLLRCLLILWVRHPAIPALIAGAFGSDEVFSYCWMNNHDLSDKMVLIHILLGSDSWLCLAFGYLAFTVPLICYSLYSSRGPMAGSGERSKRPADRVSPRLQTHCSTDAEKSLAATLARRDIGRRALTIRVLGYIMVPIISIIPGVILDILGRTSQAPVPREAVVVISIISGFMGTFNAALFSIDPSVLAVIYPPRVRKHPINHQSPTTPVPNGNATITYPSPVTTARSGTTIDDDSMDYKGYTAMPNPLPPIRRSTLDFELADAHNGL